eukprot:sb/3479331/
MYFQETKSTRSNSISSNSDLSSISAGGTSHKRRDTSLMKLAVSNHMQSIVSGSNKAIHPEGGDPCDNRPLLSSLPLYQDVSAVKKRSLSISPHKIPAARSSPSISAAAVRSPLSISPHIISNNIDHDSVTEDSDTSTSGIEVTKTSRVDMSCIVANSDEDSLESDVVLTPALMYPLQGGEFSEEELEYGTDLAGDLLAENRQYQLYQLTLDSQLDSDEMTSLMWSTHVHARGGEFMLSGLARRI